MGDPVTLALIATAVVGTGVSYSGNRRAAAQQKESGRISAAQQQADARRQRESQSRQARIRRAQVLQSAVNTGVAGSSGEFGAVNYLTAAQGEGSATLLSGEVAATALTRSNQKAADLLAGADTARQVAGISMSLAANPNAVATLKSLGPKPKGTA